MEKKTKNKFTNGQKVTLDLGGKTFYAHITGTHFYGTKPDNQKIKYDLEIKIYDEESTRIYNIDEMFIKKFNQKEYNKQLNLV
jgi:protein associated with RNAse G/E